MNLRRSLGGLPSSLLGLVRTRLELVSIEAAEEKSRLLVLLGLAAAALLFLTLALLVFTAAVAVAFWPTEHRYLALICLGGLYAAVGLALLYKVRRELADRPMPFAATLDVLERDVAALERAGRSEAGPAGQET